MSDSHIIGTIATIFILIGLILPVITDEFNTDTTTINLDSIEDAMSENVRDDYGITDYLGMAGSVIAMFFWHPGLGLTLNAIFLIFRFMFFYLVIKNLLRGA